MRLLLSLFLSLISADAVLGAEGAPERLNAAIARWQEEVNPAFADLARRNEQEFKVAWKAHRDSWLARLDNAAPGPGQSDDDKAIARARVTYLWGVGMFAYEGEQRRHTHNPGFSVTPEYYHFFGEIDVERADLMDLPEYQKFLIRLARTKANWRVMEPRFAETGIRSTAVDLEIASEFQDPTIRCFLEARAFWRHFENFAADGLTTQVINFAHRCADADVGADAMLDAFDQYRAERDDHMVKTYKEIDGFSLELHIEGAGDEDDKDKRPIVLWLHGGEWVKGSWSWCGYCAEFRRRDYILARAEYRIAGRHGTPISAAYEDAIDALVYLRRNAAQIGGDPERVILAGQSAGGHLSLLAGVKPEEGRPQAVVAFSACADLTQNGKTINLAGSLAHAVVMSPAHMSVANAPPSFIVHGRDDALCDFEAMKDYADLLEAAGAHVAFIALDETPTPPRDAARAPKLIRSALKEFLEQSGF